MDKVHYRVYIQLLNPANIGFFDENLSFLYNNS